MGIVDSSNILYQNSLDILKKYIVENKEIDFLCGTVKKDNKFIQVLGLKIYLDNSILYHLQ